MEVSVRQGQHDPATSLYFDDGDLDAFLREDVLTAMFGNRWYSVLLSRGGQAMLHAFVPDPIGNSGYFDIEPWFGYAGPIFNEATPGFVTAALKAYSGACRERRIVAELIRFHPVRRNHVPLRHMPGIQIVEGRPIAFAPIVDGDDGTQLRVYSPPCRRRVRAARRNLQFSRMADTPEAWADFVTLYYNSLRRVKAARRWYFDVSSFDRMRLADSVSIWGVFTNEARQRKLVSAALVVAAREVAYSLLVANGDLRKYKGGNDLLTHGLVRALRTGGYRWLCLGGGRSASEDDSLFVFKKKFCSGHVESLPIGFICHDPEALDILRSRAAQEQPLVKVMQPSAELIPMFMGYRLVPSLCNPEALS